MIVRAVRAEDIPFAVEALSSAFDGDPLIAFLFGEKWKEGPHVAEFFRILLAVRVSLGMPALCAEESGGIAGAVMGYDSSRPTWGASHQEEWARLMNSVAGLEARLEAYGQLAERFEPVEPHYYLGVIGVRGGQQGAGMGGALLESFCRASVVDKLSCGVYLETASEASLRFYLKNGFTVSGAGMLGKSTQLWCVFRESVHGAAA